MAQPALRSRLLLAVLLEQFARWLPVIIVLVLLKEITHELAGQRSFVDAWLLLMAQAKVTRLFAFVFGFAGVLYGFQQRNLRRSLEKQWQSRLEALESRPGNQHG
jgi:hypothetical protein